MDKIITYLNRLWTSTIAPSWRSVVTTQTKEIVKAIDDKEVVRDFTLSNVKDIYSPLVEEQKKTTQAVESIPEVSLDTVEQKLQAIIKAVEQKDLSVTVGKTEVNVDTKSVVKSVNQLGALIKKLPKKESKDYTKLLDKIIDVLSIPGKDYSQELKGIYDCIEKISKSSERTATTEDMAAIAEWLQAILQRPDPIIPQFKYDEYGNLMVTPTKVGGGGGGLTSSESTKLSNISDNTDTIAAAMGGGASWYAGANSTNNGGNSGWTFSAPPSSDVKTFNGLVYADIKNVNGVAIADIKTMNGV